jgi:hypothetical protein
MKVRPSSPRQPPGPRRSLHALGAVALASAVSITAVGTATAGGDGPSPDRAASRAFACPGLPAGLALAGNTPHRVVRVTRSGSRPLASVHRGIVTKAVRGRDGTIWVEARRVDRPNATWRRIVRIGAHGRRHLSETGNVALSHVGRVPGQRTVATYIDRDGKWTPDRDTFGKVYAEFSSGARRSLSWAVGIESFVQSAAPAAHRRRSGASAGVAVLGWSVDRAERFTFHDLRGRDLRGLFDPNDDAPYELPPLHTSPVLSPRGAKLSWAEGPDWSYEQNRLVGNWKLVVANSRTGAESVRVKVGRIGETLHHADYDGRFWVGTFSKRMNRAPKPGELRIRVVDTHAQNPRPVAAGCGAGFIASIDRFVKD